MTTQPGVTDFPSALFEVWNSPSPVAISRLVTSHPVPGDLALRSRYDTLRDLHRSITSTAISRERWDEQISLMRSGDAAVQSNRQQPGIEAFELLRVTHRAGEHPLPLIEAATGLGDLARQRDDLDVSLTEYTVAMNLAQEHGCDFARVRVGLGLGYSQLNQASARSALESFGVAIELGRERGWRLNVANALIGAGECHQRLNQPLACMRVLLEALTLFDDLSSREGIANATVQLGELCRRMRWNDEAHGWYTKAIETIEAIEATGRGGFPVAHANALDGLAEIEIETGVYITARRRLGAAARVSIPSYPRGYAHALAGLARCSFADGNLDSALRRFGGARDAYESLHLYTSGAAAATGIARTAERLEEPRLALDARLDAVRLVEQTRAAQVQHADQSEYFDRFGHYYFAALRAAVSYGSIEAFAAVFEAIAGRRLAGLLATSDEADGAHRTDRTEHARLLGQLARLNSEARQTPVGEDSRARRLARALGRIALSASLPDAARVAIDDVMAEVYQPFSLDGAGAMYANAVAGRDIVVLLAEDERHGQIVWLAQLGDQPTPHGGFFDISEETSDLLRRLRSSGLWSTAKPPDVVPLRHLLPPEVVAAVERAVGQPEDRTHEVPMPTITLIPAGRLWHVPWASVPLPSHTTGMQEQEDRGAHDSSQDRFLGEVAPLTVSPTLAYAGRKAVDRQFDANTIAGESGSLGVPETASDAGAANIAPSPPISVSWWRSNQVIHHNARALQHATVRPDREIHQLSNGADARRAIVDEGGDLTVLIGHGRPNPGTVHYLDLDDALAITPADLLDARPPKHLILLACWGAASPQTRHGDPLSIVAVALARGTESAAATTSELLDDPLASAFTNLLLNEALDRPLPEALHHSTRRFLARPDARNGYLSRWAPLIVIGH